MSPSSKTLSHCVFLLAALSPAVGDIAKAYRYLLDKTYRTDRSPGEFEKLVALKAGERMKNYYASILIMVAFLLIFLPDQIGQKHVGQIVILASAFAELIDHKCSVDLCICISQSSARSAPSTAAKAAVARGRS